MLHVIKAEKNVQISYFGKIESTNKRQRFSQNFEKITQK